MDFKHSEYTVIKELGRGASATVYLAIQKKLNRKVALKVHHQVLASKESRQRFRREALILAKLEHPNIVPIYALNELDGDAGFIMATRYLPDGTLLQRLDNLTLKSTLDIIKQLAQALEYTHAHGYLHRDIKPENVLFDGEQAMLGDFGIARPTDSLTQLTHTGSMLGTPNYMSPEQVSGDSLTSQSDLYSLGIVLYEMLTGERPFQSDSAIATGIMHINATPLPLPQGLKAFQACLTKLLAKKPKDRFASATDLLLALDEIESSLQHPDSTQVNTLRNQSEATITMSLNKQPERRQVTIVSCELYDYAQLSLRLDPEDFMVAFNTFAKNIGHIAQRFEGYVAQQHNQSVVIQFGHPFAHEDDAIRAVHTSLAIVNAIAELSLQLQPSASTAVQLNACVGIHTGAAIISSDDSSLIDQHLASGEVLRVATTIAKLADADSILVSPSTERLLANVFTREPVSINTATQSELGNDVLYEIKDTNLTTTRFQAAHGETIPRPLGRGDEMRLLENSLSQAMQGQGQVILINGEPGIGKSCLVNALLDDVSADTCETSIYQCSPYHTDTAFHPISQGIALAAKLNQLDSDRQRHARFVDVLGIDDNDFLQCAELLARDYFSNEYLNTLAIKKTNESAQEKMQKTLDILRQNVLSISQQKTVVILLEDIHWADPTTLNFIQTLQADVANKSILIILTARPEFDSARLDEQTCKQINLSRLDQQSIAELVLRTAAGNAVPEPFIRLITDKTDGVPLFIEEVTKNLLDSTSMDDVSGNTTHQANSFAVPATLQDSLIARLDRMKMAKSVAQTAACIGREFNASVLARLISLDNDELTTALAKLAQSGVIQSRGQSNYWFTHALLRDAAYESLLKSRRREIHHKLFTTFKEFDETEELIAFHANAADLSDQAIEYWQLAGEASSSRAAFSEAIGHFQNALSVVRSLPKNEQTVLQELALLVKLSHASTAVNGFAYPLTVQAYQEARLLLDKVNDTPLRFPVLYGHWVLAFAFGNHDQAAIDASQILIEAQRNQQREQILIGHRVNGSSHVMRGEFPQALQHCEQFNQLYDQQQDSKLAWQYGTDPFVSCSTYHGFANICVAKADDALKILESVEVFAFKQAHPHSVIYALAHLALISQVGCLPGRERWVQMANELADEQNLPSYQGHARGIHAMLLFDQGDIEQSVIKMEDSFEIIEKTSTHIYTTLMYGYYSAGLAKLGRNEDALIASNRAFELVQQNNERWALAEIHRLCGEQYLNSNDHESAIRQFDEALAIAEQQQSHLWAVRAVYSKASLLIQQEQLSMAKSILATALTKIDTRQQSSVDISKAVQLLADLG